MDDADVVGDRGDRRRGGGGADINAGAVGAASGGLVAGGISNPGRITHALAMSKAAAIAIAPGGAGDRSGTQEAGAVVDADGFTCPQGSSEGAADRQGSVVGAASRGDIALDDANVVADRCDRSERGGGSGIHAGGVGAAGGGLVTRGIGDAGRVTQALGMDKGAGIAIAPGCARNRSRTKEVRAVVDTDAFTHRQGRGERAADRERGVVGAASGDHRSLDDAHVVVDGSDRSRGGGGSRIHAGGVDAAGSGLVASGIGDASRITHGLGVSQRAAIAIGPGGTGDRGTTQEAGAVVDADGFTGNQGSGEAAADRQGGVVGAAAGDNGALDDADVVADRGDRRRGGRSAGVNGGGVGSAGGGLVASGIGNAGRVTQALGIGERAGIAVGPGSTGDRGTTQEAGAVVDADGFTRRKGSGEGAADR